MEKNAIGMIQFSGMMKPAQLIFKNLRNVFTDDAIAPELHELCIAQNTSKIIKNFVNYGDV